MTSRLAPLLQAQCKQKFPFLIKNSLSETYKMCKRSQEDEKEHDLPYQESEHLLD